LAFAQSINDVTSAAADEVIALDTSAKSLAWVMMTDRASQDLVKKGAEALLDLMIQINCCTQFGPAWRKNVLFLNKLFHTEQVLTLGYGYF
jgi:hypothetical protein